MISSADILQLVQEYVQLYESRGGRTSVVPRFSLGGSGFDEAEDSLGATIPYWAKSLWNAADGLHIKWVEAGFMPPLSRAVTTIEDLRRLRAELGAGSDTQPTPCLCLAEQDRVVMVVSLQESDEGSIWIWRGGAQIIAPTPWDVADFLRAQIRWLEEGPLFVQDGYIELLQPPHYDLSHLEIPYVIAHALSLLGPTEYWY